MRDGEYIDEDQVWEWFVQIVMALRYVHTWYGARVRAGWRLGDITR